MTQEESYVEWLHEFWMDVSQDYQDRLEKDFFQLIEKLFDILDMKIV